MTAAERPDAGEGQMGVTQTILADPELVKQGVYGNCMQAAVATVLGKPLDAVPHFGAFSYWPGALRLWLRGEGLDYTVVRGAEIPQGRAMLCGQSPRGYAHAVVSEGGRIVWDPHPTRAGLTLVKAAYLIHEWDTSAPTPDPIDHLMQAEHHHRETAAAEAVVGRVEALAERLIGLCDDEWLRRRDRAMELPGAKGHRWERRASSAWERAATDVRLLLKEFADYDEYAGTTEGYRRWMVNGRDDAAALRAGEGTDRG